MTERESLIKGLHELRRYLEDKEWSDECAEPHVETAIRAERFLKEQEPVKPWHKCTGEEFTLIEDSYFDYCPYCGRKLNWE